MHGTISAWSYLDLDAMGENILNFEGREHFDLEKSHGTTMRNNANSMIVALGTNKRDLRWFERLSMANARMPATTQGRSNQSRIGSAPHSVDHY